MGRPLRLDGGEAWSSIHYEDGGVFVEKESARDVLATKKTINMKENLVSSLLGLSYQELETAYGRMEMFISFYKGEIERD